MKVLLVSPYLPYPEITHAGGKFIYDFILNLKKKGVEVYLICFVTPEERGKTGDVRSLCADSCFLLRRGAIREKFSAYFIRHPFDCSLKVFFWLFEKYYFKGRIQRCIDEMTAKHGIDVMQVEYSRMAVFMGDFKFNGRKILDLHDVMIKPSEREYNIEKSPVKKIWKYLRFLKVKKMELSFCGRFDVLLAKSELDKEILDKYRDFNVKILPLGVDIPESTALWQGREENSIMFVGDMKRPFNEQAVEFFLKEVMPDILKWSRNARFYIIGDGPSEKIKHYSSENVIVTGYVEDLGGYYRKCRVFVAPLFIGGGMIFKVQQAMSFGVPVVATDIANEGIMARSGEEIFIANIPEEFKKHVIGLLSDEKVWESMSAKARAFIIENYSWDPVIRRYIDVYSTLSSPKRCLNT